MAGPLFPLLLASALGAQGDALTYQGMRAEASSGSAQGFLIPGARAPSRGESEVRGRFRLQVEDATLEPSAARGDTGALSVTLEIGADRYEVQLVSVGLPPAALARARL